MGRLHGWTLDWCGPYSHVKQADFPLCSCLWHRGWGETWNSPGNIITQTWKWHDVSLWKYFLLTQHERRRKKCIHVLSQESSECHLQGFFISVSTKCKPVRELIMFLFTVGCKMLLCCTVFQSWNWKWSRLKLAEQAEEGRLWKAKCYISLKAWRMLILP